MAFSERTHLYFSMVREGSILTLQLVGLAIVLGFLLSFPLVLMGRSRWKLPCALASAYSFLMRGTPLLVQMYLLYYGLSQFAAVRGSLLWDGFLESPYWCAVVVLSLNAAGYKAEILGGALRNVPSGDIEAAVSLGMTRRQVFWRVRYPQALRQAIPLYGNEVILLIKSSALASTITLMDLTGTVRSIVAMTYAPIPWFLLAGALYLLLNGTVAWLFRRWERHLMPYIS